MKAAVYLKDLIDHTKIEQALEELGFQYHFAQDLDHFADYADTADLLLIDMSMPNAFDIIKASPKKCICYGPHVQTDLFKKAHELGCKSAMPRSSFFGNINKVITVFLEKHETA